MAADPWVLAARRPGLLLDTNLLVLLVVGKVNRERIATFKRTSAYTGRGYDLLERLIKPFSKLYTVPHVVSEVSNLTDLAGPDRAASRIILRDLIEILHQPAIPSVTVS